LPGFRKTCRTKDSIQGRKAVRRAILLVVVAAIVAAVSSTLIQRWISGDASAAVSGGTAGAIGAVLAMRLGRRSQGGE